MSVPTAEMQDPAILAMRITAIEEAINKLTVAYQRNTQEVVRAFTMVDQHIFVMQRICSDVVRYSGGDDDALKVLDGGVDLNWYHGQYFQLRQFEQFIRWLHPLVEPELEDGDDEVFEEFGGDHEVQQAG